MSFFENLSRQAAQSVHQSIQNNGRNAGNVTYKVELSQLPVSLAQLQAMPEGTLQNRSTQQR